MVVVTETEARTTRTAAATMAGLAAPSQGSAELATWRVSIPAGSGTPVHVIDREQVWMPVRGALELTVDDSTERCSVGQAAVIPASAVRAVAALDGDAEALVAMPRGGAAMVPGSEDKIPLPWAE